MTKRLAFLALAVATPLAAQTPAPTPRTYRSNPVDTAHGDREFLLLWPDGAPGAVGTEPEDKPKLTPYVVPSERANGAAAIVCPGGGYRSLASDHEGKQVAEWLNSLGVSAFVLQYRVGPRYHHPAPMHDAQRAIRSVRSRAATYGIDAGRLGIVGFSAGGHLASTTGTHFDSGKPDASDEVERASSRPDFMILGYPVITMTASFVHKGSQSMLLGETPDPTLAKAFSNELAANGTTPPTFIFHTTEDATVPVQNAIVFYEALTAARVPAELHVFLKGTHGVGLAPSDPILSQWPKLAADWMRSLGLLTKP